MTPGQYQDENDYWATQPREASMHRILTYTGRIIDLSNPDPEQIVIEDIAHALSRINRFNGHTRIPWTVAQHSIEVSHACDASVRLFALFHDAAEAYIGDLSSPLKQVMRECGYAYDELEHRFSNLIFDKFCGRLPNDDERAMVKEADTDLLYGEMICFLPGADRVMDDRMRARALFPVVTSPTRDDRNAFIMRYNYLRLEKE